MKNCLLKSLERKPLCDIVVVPGLTGCEKLSFKSPLQVKICKHTVTSYVNVWEEDQLVKTFPIPLDSLLQIWPKLFLIHLSPLPRPGITTNSWRRENLQGRINKKGRVKYMCMCRHLYPLTLLSNTSPSCTSLINVGLRISKINYQVMRSPPSVASSKSFS